jgi:GT2 family glycosyltransferase
VRIAVVTIVHGRHAHLALQHEGLAASHRRPDHRVVVAIDDPELGDWRPPRPPLPDVVHVPGDPRGLPLARARNIGAQRAMSEGAEALVFLDVDCIPSPELVGTYEQVLGDPRTAGDVMCGPVTYLPPPPEGGYELGAVARMGTPHAARPCPPRGRVDRGNDRYDLFWSLSFAVSARTWDRIGGFDESYVGYGGEDTDFGRRAQAAGIALTWVGGADAFHQHHPVSRPPVEHVVDIVRNATIFHRRWGSWPMQGWLDAFVERGLVTRGPDGAYAVASAADGVLDVER